MRVLVTGASGHLGAAVVERLLADGAEVTALVRPGSDLWRLEGALSQITLLRADLAGMEQAADGIAAARAEAVIHLAWQGVTNAARNDPEQITQNVPGTLELCEVAHKAGCRCWVGMGSQAEYGSAQGVLTEGLPLHPHTAYGSAKLAAEMLTQKLCELYGVRFVWFRLLATYGPQDDERHLIPSVIQKLLRGERPTLTAGDQQWDYLYITDAADAIVQAVLAQVHGVFNLASGEAEPVRYIVERIRDLIDPALPLGFGELPYPPDQVMHLQADISKLVQATGWNPRVDLSEGLARTIEFYKAHRSGKGTGHA